MGALGCWFGALAGEPVSLLGSIAFLVAGLLLRMPLLWVVAVALVASTLMAGALADLAAVEGGISEGTARVVSDAEWRGSAIRLDVELEGRRWEVWARGSSAYRVDSALVGERWWMQLSTRPAGLADQRWLWPRRVAGRASLQSVRRVDAGSAPYRLANRIRSLIVSSAGSMSKRDRILLTGFVHGDDRGQLPEVVDDFRATGLTHLLAVSGSNVAMVLVMFDGLLRRLGRWWRLAAVVSLLGEFILLTRGEPSVLRACVLAVLATGASSAGRPATSLRLLALATAVLVLFDPLLVRSVGFQLSVAASLGIVVAAKPISRHLPGPQWIRSALGVTLAAQLAVLPVQLATFGSLPVASIPANVLAGPAAGPAMVWGLNAGLLGGFAGEPVAGALHLPTRLLVGWVAFVAERGATAGLPEIDRSEAAAALAVVLVAAVVVVFWPAVRVLAVLAGAAALILVAGQSSAAVPSYAELEVVSGDTTIVVIDRPSPSWALGALRNSGVDRIDVLISRSAGVLSAEAVRVIRARIDVGEVWAPSRLRGQPTVVIDDLVEFDSISVRRVDQRLVVELPG